MQSLDVTELSSTDHATQAVHCAVQTTLQNQKTVLNYSIRLQYVRSLL
jgi:hypothetical protein